jgi:membrane-bound metal-dependent hydrolase YbcI (DUF457 family)
MFVGHYSAAFAAKAVAKTFKVEVPLWALFLAVQLVDVFWALFLLLGIERARIVPGITAASPLDLVFMPYTHSLPAALLWSCAAGLVWWAWRRAPHAALFVGLAVASHWLLDYLVHRPDLPLWGDLYKVGLGLWNYRAVSILLELGLLCGAAFWCVRTRATPLRRSLIIVTVLAVAALINLGMPPPASVSEVAASGLAAFLVLAWAAHWAEAKQA